MGTSLNDVLARWLDDRPAPAVDCGACAKFGKCCDFQPFVPNVLLGAALAAGVALARSPKFTLQPIGLVPARSFRNARDQRGARAASSRDELCAFYDGGRCRIWTWRPGECSSYHCVGEAPDLAAEAFAFETTLAQMALVEQGWDQATVARQIDILNDPGDQLTDAARVEVTYRRAWDWARHLSRADLERWLEDR